MKTGKAKKQINANTDMPNKAADNAKPIDEAELYNEAVQILGVKSDNLALYQKARALLIQIPNYKDSSKLIEECSDKIISLTMRESQKAQKKKRIILVAVILIIGIVVALLVLSKTKTVDKEKQDKYNLAIKILNDAKALEVSKQDSKYNSAYTILSDLGDYNNATALITQNRVERIKTLTDKGLYDEAMLLYQKMMVSSKLIIDESVEEVMNMSPIRYIQAQRKHMKKRIIIRL